MIYNLYIFNRSGRCLYYREWNIPKKGGGGDKSAAENGGEGDGDSSMDEEKKRLVFGMVYSIKELIGKMSSDLDPQGLHTLKTDAYCLHHLETGSGLRFILNTGIAAGDVRPNLSHIYSELYLEYVCKNVNFDPKSGAPIDSPTFDAKLEEYIRGLSSFDSSS